MPTSTAFRLRLPSPLVTDMLARAVASLPNECCGMLAGHRDAATNIATATHVYPLINTLASPTEYAADPKGMLVVMRTLRQEGTELLALYHSHPTSEPVPSARDLASNHYGTSIMHVIIGFTQPRPELRGWWLSEQDYHPGELEIIAASPE